MAALLRDTLGEVLRAERIDRGMTLRQVSTAARVSLGYLSEIERGQKEASSELLAAVCEAMQLPLSHVLLSSAKKLAATEVAVLTPVVAAA